MPRKPAHQQADTLKLIQDASFELFGRYGYDGVSIGDIATAANLSKSALYWHFSSKEALYLDCLTRLHAIFEQHIYYPMRAESEPVQAVLKMFEGLARLMQDPRVEKGVAGYWLLPSGPATRALEAAQRAFEQASHRQIMDCLRRGADQGHFDFQGDLEEMARAIISVQEASVLPLRHLAPQEVQRIVAVLGRTLFRAYAKGIPPTLRLA
jgi:AcrR family transcriptional regulator